MTKVKAEIFRTKNKQFAFRLVHRNGNKLTCSETYTQKASAAKACTNLCLAIAAAQIEFVDLTQKK